MFGVILRVGRYLCTGCEGTEGQGRLVPEDLGFLFLAVWTGYVRVRRWDVAGIKGRMYLYFRMDVQDVYEVSILGCVFGLGVYINGLVTDREQVLGKLDFDRERRVFGPWKWEEVQLGRDTM